MSNEDIDDEKFHSCLSLPASSCDSGRELSSGESSDEEVVSGNNESNHVVGAETALLNHHQQQSTGLANGTQLDIDCSDTISILRALSTIVEAESEINTADVELQSQLDFHRSRSSDMDIEPFDVNKLRDIWWLSDIFRPLVLIAMRFVAVILDVLLVRRYFKNNKFKEAEVTVSFVLFTWVLQIIYCFYWRLHKHHITSVKLLRSCVILAGFGPVILQFDIFYHQLKYLSTVGLFKWRKLDEQQFEVVYPKSRRADQLAWLQITFLSTPQRIIQMALIMLDFYRGNFPGNHSVTAQLIIDNSV